MKYQFWLKQLFLATTLVAALLCIAKWCYIEYIDRIIPITSKGSLIVAEDGHDRYNILDVYVGRRVSFCGTYQTIGCGSSGPVVWFGDEPIAIVSNCTRHSSLSRIPDGALIAVTGRLAWLPANATTQVTIERHHAVVVTRGVVYCINPEEVREAAGAREPLGLGRQ